VQFKPNRACVVGDRSNNSAQTCQRECVGATVPGRHYLVEVLVDQAIEISGRFFF
jgi:hypothetical protein